MPCVGLCVLSSLAIILLRKRESWFLYFNCVLAVLYPFSASRPHGAVDWSAICGCDVSWSYSLSATVANMQKLSLLKYVDEC